MYKLIRIQNHDKEDKTDSTSLSRIGRIFNIDPPVVGERLWCECVLPGIYKSMITSAVLGVCYQPSATFVVKTENSFYTFEWIEMEEVADEERVV